MNITTREVGDVTVLEIKGQMSLAEGTALLRNTIRNLHRDHKTKIVLDMGETGYIDSSGIGELVSAWTTTSNQGGSFKLLALTRKPQELLTITKLLSVFDAFDDEAKAVASFGNKPVPFPALSVPPPGE